MMPEITTRCVTVNPRKQRSATQKTPLGPPTGAHCKHHICRAKQHQQQGKLACARGSAASIWCRRSRGDMLGSTPVMPLDMTTLAPRMSRWPRLPGPSWNWTTRNLSVSATLYDEESARAKLKFVAVLAEAKRGLPPLRARHVGRTEWKRPGAVLTFAGGYGPCFEDGGT